MDYIYKFYNLCTWKVQAQMIRPCVLDSVYVVRDKKSEDRRESLMLIWSFDLMYNFQGLLRSFKVTVYTL